jgi:uncharacterized protein (DUF934 family)
MPLMREGVFFADEWVGAWGDGEIPETGKIIVPLARMQDAAARLTSGGGQTGVHVPNTVNLQTLKLYFNSVALISVAFPAFNDGRGFSIARRLRRLGFTGILRATGPLIADQYAYALACGFDEIALPDAVASRQPAEHWQKAADAISLSYQRGYHRPTTILDRRRAASA